MSGHVVFEELSDIKIKLSSPYWQIAIVKLDLKDYLWEITNPNNKEPSIRCFIPYGGTVHLLLFHEVISKVADILEFTAPLVPPQNLDEFQRNKLETHRIFRREGRKKKIGKCIAKRLSEWMRKIIGAKVSEDLLLLHKTAFSCYGYKKYGQVAYKIRPSTLLQNDKIDKEGLQYLIRDIRNGYKAAIHWFYVDEYELANHNCRNPKDWMRLFVPWRTEKIPHIIAKTLLSIKRFQFLFFFQEYCRLWGNLPKQFESSLELSLYLLSRKLMIYDEPREKAHTSSLLKSTKSQIFKAKKLIEEHLRSKLDFRKTKDMRKFLQFLYDYPEVTNCEIVGLAQRSITWHIEQRKIAIKEAEEYAKRLVTKIVASPPIPFPVESQIKFLATAKEIVMEGRDMNHCVASYVNDATQGRCYLFHVEHNGEAATAEVTKEGELRQIHGPYNSDNKACKFGERILKKWGQKLKKYIASGGNTAIIIDTQVQNEELVGVTANEEMPF